MFLLTDAINTLRCQGTSLLPVLVEPGTGFESAGALEFINEDLAFAELKHRTSIVLTLPPQEVRNKASIGIGVNYLSSRAIRSRNIAKFPFYIHLSVLKFGISDVAAVR
jgi:hypothetical protein